MINADTGSHRPIRYKITLKEKTIADKRTTDDEE